jgi:ectoine hydroxylase-related dioxygenase (phytanoyl-CoA dioxygenase family)
MEVLTKTERQQLDDDGYVALRNIVDAKAIVAMRARLDELLTATPQDHAGTLIVGGLLDEPVFDAAWRHPRVLAAVAHVLGGENCRLVGVFSRGLRPGHGQQALHTDWGGAGIPGIWYQCHAICPLIDFSEKNGATRVVPGSHRNPWMLKGHSDLRKPHPKQRQLVGPAGTVFVLNVHCMHSAVHNASNEPRMVIFTSFTRRDSPLLLQSPLVDPSPSTLERHTPEIKALLKG